MRGCFIVQGKKKEGPNYELDFAGVRIQFNFLRDILQGREK